PVSFLHSPRPHPDLPSFPTRRSSDLAALLSENSSVVTDLSKLGAPGTPFTHDFFLSATLLSFPQAAIDNVSKIDGVTSATAGLRSEEHTSELQSRENLVCRLLLEKKK